MQKQIFQSIDTLVKVSNISLAKSWYAEKLGLSIIEENDDMVTLNFVARIVLPSASNKLATKKTEITRKIGEMMADADTP